MAIGSFMGRVFTVSHTKIFTPSNLKGSTGSDWATHEVVGGKARSEWVGPKLKSYTFDLLLRAQDGVPPRSTLDYFQRMAESSAVDWFVVGGVPLSPYPFKITDISEHGTPCCKAVCWWNVK